MLEREGTVFIEGVKFPPKRGGTWPLAGSVQGTCDSGEGGVSLAPHWDRDCLKK